jgi:hypothetical protein
MHDARIEDMLRRTLQAEAGSMPMTITVGVLERRLVERRRQTRTTRRMLAAAAVAAVAILGGVVVLSQLQANLPPVAVSPSPSAVPTPAVILPEASELLSGYPTATIRLERAEGPATGPVDPPDGAAPGASPAPVEVGRVRFGGPFVVGLACLGEGEMVVQVTSPNLLGEVPYTTAFGPCDGTPVIHEYMAAPVDPTSSGDVVKVAVSPGTSWRLAVGELPASAIAPPEFAPIAMTPGWNLIVVGSPVQLSATAPHGPRTGAYVNVPDEATRIAIIVQCHGSGSLIVTVNDASPADVACDPSGTTRRLEFPAAGGEPLSLAAAGDRAGLWVNLIVEANAEIASTYPSAPPLPPGLADVPYVAPDNNVLAFGTLGSNRQTILPVSGTMAGHTSGDLLPVGRSNEVTGARLELVSISGANVIRTLAVHPAPAFIFDSWVDATHGQVYYALGRPTTVEFRRVSIQGTGDSVIATVPREGRTGFTARLAADDTVFVVDACLTGPLCTRTIADGATGEVSATDRASDPLCRILGIADGLIVATSRPICTEEAPTSLLAVPLDGGAPRIVADSIDRDVSDGVVVVTPDGLTVAYGAFDGAAVTTKLIDVETGKVAALPSGAVGDPTLIPSRSAPLPEGWILLSGGGLGDFPWQKALDRPAPVLVNVVTGERIELVNLPHWKGSYEF